MCPHRLSPADMNGSGGWESGYPATIASQGFSVFSELASPVGIPIMLKYDMNTNILQQ